MASRFPSGVDRIHRTVVVSAMGVCVVVMAYTLTLYAKRGAALFLWRAAFAAVLLAVLTVYLRWFVRRISALR